MRAYQLATLVEFFGERRLTEISTALVDRYKAARLKSVRASSLNNELRVLKTVLRWAASDRGYEVAEHRIRRLRVPFAGRVKFWTAAEVHRLVDSAASDDPELVPMLLFLLNTGCRKGEAIAAEWRWVDLAAGVLSIPVTATWKPKSGKPREVPIGDVLAESLRARTPSPSRWLFPSCSGERFEWFPDARFAAVVKAAGLTGGPHKCRHTYASHFLEVLPDMQSLAAILGHSSTRVTELYAHLLPGYLDRARAAVNRMGGALVATRSTDRNVIALDERRSRTVLQEGA